MSSFEIIIDICLIKQRKVNMWFILNWHQSSIVCRKYEKCYVFLFLNEICYLQRRKNSQTYHELNTTIRLFAIWLKTWLYESKKDSLPMHVVCRDAFLNTYVAIYIFILFELHRR